jgi:hypothetical protein
MKSATAAAEAVNPGIRRKALSALFASLVGVALGYLASMPSTITTGHLPFSGSYRAIGW